MMVKSNIRSLLQERVPDRWPETWIESEVVALPSSKVTEPTVLVRRRTSDLVGPHGEELVYLDGPPAITLFTGAGGIDIGLEGAGYTVVCQVEMDKVCCETLIANRPNFFRHAALIQGDIFKTPTSLILDESGLRVGEARLIAGGPPCQGFSQLNTNARKNRKDKRNDLVFEYLRVVREGQPHFFMFENVPGFVTFNNHEYLKAFLQEAYGCYYELVYGLIDAVEYNVPQYRSRFICIGTRRDIAEIDGMIAGLPEPQNFHDRDLQRIKLYESSLIEHAEDLAVLKHAPGVRYFPDREILIPPTPIRGEGRTKTVLEFYERLRREEPDRIVELRKEIVE